MTQSLPISIFFFFLLLLVVVVVGVLLDVDVVPSIIPPLSSRSSASSSSFHPSPILDGPHAPSRAVRVCSARRKTLLKRISLFFREHLDTIIFGACVRRAQPETDHDDADADADAVIMATAASIFTPHEP